jgi:signal transduction histidine kinase
MNGFAQLLTENYAGHLDDRGRDYLQRISTGASRLDLLIQEVLNYTHLIRAQTELTRVDLDKLVRDIIHTQPDWQPDRVEIQIEGTLPAVLGQVGLLTQCISNLLGNAIKFVAPGITPRIRIWAEPSTLNSQPSTKVLFQDNGIGIAPEHHDRVFRMFERVRPATEYEGTGMGLTIVRKAVERMHGKLDFESEPGRGTTFWIELRRAEA